MHDLAEGIIPLTIQLVLSSYYKRKKMQFTKSFINSRISSFSYGFADRKNRPSSNITVEMLSAPDKHKLKQTAAQHFLLLRSFTFLFADKIDRDCQFIVMIGHLINVTRILLSPVVSEDMLVWLNEHLRLFQDLFYQNFSKRINKGHHLLHYEECIRRSGNVKQFNCLPFEQKNKPLKTQASSCRNFKNICKSLAERQTLTMVIDVLDNPLCDKTVHKPGQRKHKNNIIAGDRLLKDVEYVFCPKVVLLNGVEFRKNLLVALKHHGNALFPVVRNNPGDNRKQRNTSCFVKTVRNSLVRRHPAGVRSTGN